MSSNPHDESITTKDMTGRQPTKRLIDVEVTMLLEEYTEVVDVPAFMNTNQAVMDVRLNCGISKDTLRERVPICGVNYTARGDLHLASLAASGRV
jgi:hypothetical protein